MNKKLKNIATITTGVHQRRTPSGDTYYLHAKHFDEQGELRKDIVLSPEVQMDKHLKRHILQEGDLLLIAKGGNNRVFYYHSEIGQAVASSIFFVIRLKKSNILPKYLQWFLNTSKVRAILAHLSRGTQILSLSKKDLAELSIEIPNLAQQKEILALQALWDKERKITIELLELKKSLYQHYQYYQLTIDN